MEEAEADRDVLPAWIVDMDFVVLPGIKPSGTNLCGSVGLWLYLCKRRFDSVGFGMGNQPTRLSFDKMLLSLSELVPAAIEAFTKGAVLN